jgi:hypothetical protein
MREKGWKCMLILNNISSGKRSLTRSSPIVHITNSCFGAKCSLSTRYCDDRYAVL